MSLPNDSDLIHVSMKQKDNIFIENDIKAIVFNSKNANSNQISFDKIVLDNQLECKIYDISLIEKMCLNQNILMHEIFQSFEIYNTDLS